MEEDKVLQKIGEHGRRFDTVERKFDELGKKVLTAQDEIMTVLRRLDEERVFTTRWVERIEKEVERHEREITEVKKRLQIS